jgi:hypothetical protein
MPTNLAPPVPADPTVSEPAEDAPAPPPTALSMALPPAPASQPGVSPTAVTVAPAPTTSKRRMVTSGSALKRTFALTKQAAASMAASGMDVSQIAVALGVTPRQVRKALQLGPVESPDT